MSTPAQAAASIRNAQASSGPRSIAGKAASSKNATTSGLFTANDFIRPGEEADYGNIVERLDRELTPATLLEENMVDEIRRAMWRLRRCAHVEGTFASQLTSGSDVIPDPLQNEAAAKLQNSVDRARAQAHRLLHRCTTELRRLQTDRLYLAESLPEGTDVAHLGIGDFRAVMKGLDERTQADLRTHKLEGTDNLVSILENQHRRMAATAPAPVTKRTQDAAEPQAATIGRNSPCPCNSGLKYKRCCGRNAPAMLHAV